MNVLLVFWGKTGGIPKFTYEMADGLVRAGYNVYAVLSENIYNREEWDSNKKIKDICYIYTGDSKSFLKASLKMFTSTKRYIKDYFNGIEFDVSICMMPYPWCRTISSYLGVKKSYIICHDPIAHSGANRFLSYLIEQSTKGYDDVIVMTKKFIPIVKQKYKYSIDKIHYMRHGKYGYQKVNTPEGNNDKIRFLFFGSIHKYKGIGILLKAYKIVCEKTDNVSLTIAGKGDLDPFKDDLNKVEVELINRFIDDAEIGPLFSIPNTVVVLPYLDATQSGVIPVAMEYGVPIIASNTGGLKEQLFDGELGVFFKTKDYGDLAEKMLCFVNDSNLLEKQRLINNKLLELLDWKVILRNLLEG